MIAYFDDLANGNCKELNSSVLFPLDVEYVKNLSQAQFKVRKTELIYQPGVYILRTRDHGHRWSGDPTVSATLKNILYYLPDNILQAARDQKIIVCIDNQAEGFSLDNIKSVDVFNSFHLSMKELNLPQYSVLFIDSNYNFNQCYLKWCLNNDCVPMIAHCYFMTGFYYFKDNIPSEPLVKIAMTKESSCDFNSLNRTARSHRLQHLYWVIKNNLHTKNLISGNYHNTKNPLHKLDGLIMTDFDQNDINLLTKTMPLIIDGDWTLDNPDDNNIAIFNHNIYKNSLLSFVTCTAFAQDGLFITEKVFKPIVAGHPFIVLAQKNALKFLKYLGYQTDFEGIDQSYDSIDDPLDRFQAAHKSLENWILLSRDKKLEIIEKNLPAIIHNQMHYCQQDYVSRSFNHLHLIAREIIYHKYSVYEKNKFCLS